jgi:hypothetical protein
MTYWAVQSAHYNSATSLLYPIEAIVNSLCHNAALSEVGVDASTALTAHERHLYRKRQALVMSKEAVASNSSGK